MVEEQCLVLIKPDGLVKSLTGNIITTLSETRLKIVGAKIVRVGRELAEKHYSKLKNELIEKHGHEKGEEIYNSVLDYIQGKYHTDRVMALVYHGEDAIKKIRNLCGKTNPEEADSITIRGKYGRINSKTKVFENVVHASDSKEIAEQEIKLWFKPSELAEVIYPTEIKFCENCKSEELVWK
ncbi:MAG: nucleoside-diphosphate kinase, partial [Candidatus Pacearchaeota archaeon]